MEEAAGLSQLNPGLDQAEQEGHFSQRELDGFRRTSEGPAAGDRVPGLETLPPKTSTGLVGARAVIGPAAGPD